MSLSEPGTNFASYTSPDSTIIDETIARSRQIMKESEQIANRNQEIKALLDKRLRSPNSISSRPDIVPKSALTDRSMSPKSFVQEQRTPPPNIYISDEQMSPSFDDKDVNAQSLLDEIENLKKELIDCPRQEFTPATSFLPKTIKPQEYEDRLKGEEYLKLGYEKVANELRTKIEQIEAENSRLKQVNTDLKIQSRDHKNSADELALHNREKDRLKSEIAKVQEFLGKYDADLIEANQERQMLIRENESLREQKNRIQKENFQPDREKETLKDDLIEAKQQIMRLQENYDSAYARLRSELTAERSSGADISEDNSALLAKNAALSERVVELEDRLGDMEKKLEEQHTYCNELKDLVTVLRAVDNRSPNLQKRPRVKLRRKQTSEKIKIPKRSLSTKKLKKDKKSLK